MKRLLFLTCITLSLAFCSCGTKKAYVGRTQDKASLAIVKQGHNSFKEPRTYEYTLLIQVDSIVVGNYFKGYPQYCYVLPGTHTVEIRHFQEWNDRYSNATATAGVWGGAIGGAIAGSMAESNNPHKHYLVTFDAEVGKSYIIMAVTDLETQEADIYVVDESTNERIQTNVELKEKQ